MPKSVNMLNSSAQKGLMGALAQIGGLDKGADLMGKLILQNEDKLIQGMNNLEKQYESEMLEEGFQSLQFSFIPMTKKDKNGKPKTRMGVLLHGVKANKDPETPEVKFLTSKPFKTMDLDQFIQMLVKGAKKAK